MNLELLLKKLKNLSNKEKQKLLDAIIEALKKSDEIIAELKESRKFDSKILYDEFDI